MRALMTLVAGMSMAGAAMAQTPTQPPVAAKPRRPRRY